MFPRGPRFVDPKIPDFPGPNAYNPGQESQLDSYKRGAFLEKANRFNKDKPSDIPGPGAYNTEHTKPGHVPRPQSQASGMADKCAVLQRKLEDLERTRAEDRKTAHTEIERLKFDLARLQKANADQTDGLEKQKKLNDVLEARVQELKKAALVDQADLKDLRAKLRVAEHERAHLAGRQGELDEAKKALHAAEARRKDEAREREKRIAELEKALAGEKKRQEAMDSRFREAADKSAEELSVARALSQRLQTEADTALAEKAGARSALQEMEASHEHLVAQLDQHCKVLSRVVEEYGRLATSTVPSSEHARVRQENTALRIQSLRLSRKLANAEDQTKELAHLVRCTREENGELRRTMNEREEEIRTYTRVLSNQERDGRDGALGLSQLARDSALIEKELLETVIEARLSRIPELEASEELYSMACQELLSLCELAENRLGVETAHSAQSAAELAKALAERDSVAAELEAARSGWAETQAQLAEATNSSRELEKLRDKLAEAEQQLKVNSSKTQETLRKEQEATQRLTGAVQRSRIIENGLRDEIEQLATELDEVARYQKAYYELSDEVGGILARNTLAEEEAERLSKFNAEILGHHNPAQRIMYVERIRRDLAVTKQKLLVETLHREAVQAGNQELQQELAMYKSVTVPTENKPRTHVTRVDRVPFATQNMNKNTTRIAGGSGHMTLEEIL